MDILDELRAKSERQQQKLGAEQARHEQVEQRYQNEILPAMRAIRRYLGELANHLKFVGQEIPFQFNIPGYGPVTDLELRDHGVQIDSSERMTRLFYGYRCASREPLLFRVIPKQAAEECRNWLSELRQKSTEWPVRNGRGEIIGFNFEVELVVPVVFHFIADIESGRIRINYTNFRELGTSVLTVPASEVDQDWLNKLGAFLLKRSEDLVLLPVEEEQRAALRRRLTQEALDRDVELRMAEGRTREQGQRGLAESLLDKLKNKIGEIEKKR